MKKSVQRTLAILLTFIFAMTAVPFSAMAAKTLTGDTVSSATYILDAGHGGVDCGAKSR